MFWITSKPYSFPPTNIQNLPIEILYQITAWCCPKDVTQFSMASKLFSPIRNELFAKSKTLIIQNGIYLNELSNLIKDKIQSVKVIKRRNFNYTTLTRFKKLLHLLETLILQNNQIVDVSPLASLNYLKTLDIRSNQITDISSLASVNIPEFLHNTNS